ncbi:hypothetical protein [Isoptericola sp. NPDC056605]|uniref:hypothetical protein n=1 Tax=Isoptericola sp. NPDC056605 TaxID=3345876 RepID=UPI0036BC4863
MTKQLPEHGAWKPKPSSEDWTVGPQARRPTPPATVSGYLEHYDRTGEYPPGADDPRNASIRAAADALLAARAPAADAVEPAPVDTASDGASKGWRIVAGVAAVLAVLWWLNQGDEDGGRSTWPDEPQCSLSQPQNC